jgi:hypothetical protein
VGYNKQENMYLFSRAFAGFVKGEQEGSCHGNADHIPDILISESFKLLKLGKEGGTTSSASSRSPSPSDFSGVAAIFPGGRPGRGLEAFLPVILPTVVALSVVFVCERSEALIAVGVEESFASLVGEARL